jgi:5-methylcytosine-specific restriction protein A
MATRLTAIKPRVQPLRAQRAPAPLTTKTVRITGWKLAKIRERIFRRDRGLCQCELCQAPGAIPLAGEEVDHRIPLWEGGVDTDDAAGDANRVLLSKECHLRKSAQEAKRRGGR